MSKDSELRAQYDQLKAESSRYEAVKWVIQGQGLSEIQTTREIENWLDYVRSMIQIIEQDEGYHYLATAREKLQKELELMEEYVTFVKDANMSYKNLYADVSAKLSSMSSQMASIKSEYNQGKMIWDHIW